jgi:hypothetical protein
VTASRKVIAYRGTRFTGRTTVADDDPKNPSQREVLVSQMRRSRLAQRNPNARPPAPWDGMRRVLGLDPNRDYEAERLQESERQRFRALRENTSPPSPGGRSAENTSVPVNPETAAPMPPRDRRFWVTLAIWAAIPVGLFLAGVGAFVSGSPHWGIGLGLPGLVGAYFVTLHLLERRPHKLPVPSPLLIAVAILTWIFIGWQTWLWLHTPAQGYTQAQLDKAVEDGKAAALKNEPRPAPVVIHDPPSAADIENATAPIRAERDDLKQKLADALNKPASGPTADDIAKTTSKILQLQAALDDMTRQKEAASQIAPIGVERVPTTLRLLFKADDIEEIEAKNITWTKLVTTREQKTPTVFGERSNTILVWALILVFKKPINFKEIRFEDHGAYLPKPDVTSSSPRYAVIEFGSNFGYQSVLMDITFK